MVRAERMVVLLRRLYGTFHTFLAWSIYIQTISRQILCIGMVRGPKNDEVLRHPPYGRQWKALGVEYTHFKWDDGNLMLGYNMDGMNPFGNKSSLHNTWPMVVCIHNLPPSVTMKRKYQHMVVQIQGPSQPGNNLNLYVQLFKEELEILWSDEGVDTWDALTGEYFPMSDALFTTVQNYPAYEYQSDRFCHRNCACFRCMNETLHLYLKQSHVT